MRDLIRECNRSVRVTGLILALVICFSAPSAAADVSVIARWERPVHNNIMYYHYVVKAGNSKSHVYVADMDLSKGDLRIQPVLAWDRMERLETVGSLAKRHTPVVAINGSYFNRNPRDTFPVGFLMLDGRVVYFSHTHRSAFGLTRDNTPLFGYPKTKGSIYLEDTGQHFYINGMNRERKKNEAIVYSMEYGPRTETKYAEREIVVKNGVVTDIGTKNMPIPTDGFVLSLHGDALQYANLFKKGTRTKLYFVIESEWLKVYNALTGGPMLLQNGQVVTDGAQREQFHYSSSARNPLTAVAAMPNGRVLFVVVDGRRPGFSSGLSYIELATFLRSIGAINAIGMDGGGSSTMVINGQVMNKPSDGSLRAVSNALCVFQKR